jgi:hypothetical protein
MAALLYSGPAAQAQQLIDAQQPERPSGELGGAGVDGTSPQPATDPGVSLTDEPLEQVSAPTPDASDAGSSPASEPSLGSVRTSAFAQEPPLPPAQQSEPAADTPRLATKLATGEQAQRTDEPVNRTIEPVVDPVVGTVGQATGQPVTEPVHRKIEPVVEPVVEPVHQAVEPVRQTVEPVVDQVGQTPGPVIEPVARTVEPTLEPVRHAADPVTEPVHQTIDPVVEPVRQTVEPTLEPVREAVGPAIEPVRQTVEPVQETVTPVVEPVHEAADPVAEPALQPVVGSPQGGPPQGGLPQGSVASGPTEQGALTPAADPPAAALVPAPSQVPASGAPAGPAAAEPPYGVANPGSEPGLEEGVLRRDAGAPADAPVASRPTDLSASRGAEQQAPRVFDASLPAASSTSAASERLMVSSNGRPVVGKQILGTPGIPGAIEILDYTRPFANILADAYPTLSGTSAAGGALSPAPASGSPVPAAPASPAGLLGSAFGGSGFGAGGFLVGALALLFVLSPAGGRILQSFCDFLRPTSALILAIERPG